MCETYKITKNDCIKILQKHLRTKNFELLEFEEKSVSGEVVGIMSGHYKLKTKTKTDGKIISNSFFVKRTLSQYRIQTQFIKESGAYEKENFAYGQLRELYEKEKGFSCDFMPNCYLSVEDQLFVFEDVSQDEYTMNKCKADILDSEHLMLALDMIAKFHAGSIIYEHKKSAELGRQYKMDEDFSEYCKEYMYRKSEDYIGNLFYKTSVKSVLGLLDIVPYYKDNKNEIKNKFLTQADRVYELVKPSNEFLNVVCHGDLWNSNLLFKYDKNDNPLHCKILDFQALRYTVPAHDYLYIVHMNSFETDSRKNYVLSRFYYSSLQNYLNKSDVDINKYMTYEQFLASIDYIYPFIVVQNACFANLCIARVNEDIPKSETLFAKCMYEDRSEWCIEAYKNNDLFRNLVDIALKVLKEL